MLLSPIDPRVVLRKSLCLVSDLKKWICLTKLRRKKTHKHADCSIFTSWQARHQLTARSSLWQTYQVLRCQRWVRLMLLISCITKSFKTNSQKRMNTEEIELFGQGDGVLWSSLALLRWHPILQRLTNLLTQQAPCSFVVIMLYHFPSSQDFFSMRISGILTSYQPSFSVFSSLYFKV